MVESRLSVMIRKKMWKKSNREEAVSEKGREMAFFFTGRIWLREEINREIV